MSIIINTIIPFASAVLIVSFYIQATFTLYSMLLIIRACTHGSTCQISPAGVCGQKGQETEVRQWGTGAAVHFAIAVAHMKIFTQVKANCKSNIERQHLQLLPIFTVLADSL